jgi:hypothetical protein
MAKNNSVLVTFVNRQGKVVKELCHNPRTCREHAPYIYGEKNKAMNVDVMELPEEGITTLDAIYRNVDAEQVFNTKSELAYSSKDENVLADLSFDQDPLIRSFVASNPNTSKHVLKRLYNEKTPEADYIWKAVVGNPNAPYRVLSNAALSRDEKTLRILASNPAAAGWMLQVITPKIGDPITLELIAQHPKTPSGTLDYLSKHEDQIVRSYAATNRNMKLETLQRLAAEDVPVVRAGVAYNGNITDEMALDFVADTSLVRRGLARNPYRSKFSAEVQVAIALLGDL